MKCSACENELQKIVVAGITVHACLGECGGLWFDRFQFNKIKLLQPGIGKSLVTIERAEGVKFYRGAEHPCPACKTTLLYRHFFNADWDTEIDQCSKCRGFWIDLAGLAKLQTLPANQRIQAVEKYFNTIINKKLVGMRFRHGDMAEQALILEQIFLFLCPDYNRPNR
ncbi:MAG: zf-TFIIB domain-containing protein [Nitrospinaceae bacterium]